MSRQDRIEHAAYKDGKRCMRKGLGVTAKGHYDRKAMRRLFERWCPACPDIEAAYDAWFDGWQDEAERLDYLRQGLLPCGRPI